MPRQTHPFVLALAFAALATGTCLAAMCFHGMWSAVPGMPLAALMLLVLDAIVLVRVGRWALGDRGRAVTALAAGGLSAPLVIGALHALSEPIAFGNHWRCGTGEMMLLMMAPPALFVAAALAALLALPAALGEARGAERRMRALAWLGALTSAALVIAGAWRGARHPDPDHYVASLPVVARVHTIAGEPRYVEGVERTPGEKTEIARRFEVYDDAIGPVVLRRTCFHSTCQVRLVKPDSQEGLDDLVLYPGGGYGDQAKDTRIEVRRDEAHQVWLVDAGRVTSYLGPKLIASDLQAADVASAVAPPPAWLAGAAAGLVFAGALALVRRRPLSRRRAAIAGGREGVLEESGAIRFDDGEPPVRAAAGQDLAPGPVVVLPGALAPGGVYRGDASRQGAIVVSGRKDELLGAASEALARLDALAFAVCALSGAPLVAAAILGLVF